MKLKLSSSNREKNNFEMWRIHMLVYVINPDSITLKKVIIEQHYTIRNKKKRTTENMPLLSMQRVIYSNWVITEKLNSTT